MYADSRKYNPRTYSTYHCLKQFRDGNSGGNSYHTGFIVVEYMLYSDLHTTQNKYVLTTNPNANIYLPDSATTVLDFRLPEVHAEVCVCMSLSYTYHPFGSFIHMYMYMYM